MATRSTLVASLVLATIVVGCGTGGVRDELRDLGASDDYVDCLESELQRRGLSLDDLDVDPGPDDPPAPAGVLVAIDACAGAGAPEAAPRSSPLNGGTNGEVEVGVYGSDPDLDLLHDACAVGNGAACDDLYFRSRIDSEYETFGATCGARFAEPPGSCQDAIGPIDIDTETTG